MMISDDERKKIRTDPEESGRKKRIKI